jgi:hypothetical protein
MKNDPKNNCTKINIEKSKKKRCALLGYNRFFSLNIQLFYIFPKLFYIFPKLFYIFPKLFYIFPKLFYLFAIFSPHKLFYSLYIS